MSQINGTLMCFGNVLRKIETSNKDNSFGNKTNEQSAIIKELTDKYSKMNIHYIIRTRMKQAIIIIKEDYRKVINDISSSFTEVETYTIALKKCFDTSQEELSKLTMKLNKIISDNTRQTELWKEMKIKEYMYKTELINLIQGFKHEFRNSQRCSTRKMNDIEKLLHTLPQMPPPLNQNEGTKNSNPEVLDVESSQLKNKFSTPFLILEP
ncbi:hypothetical protein O181_088586 [Austropuccinia psidii MF-1]|uniref:Uncharacterized protein n=1 Tax=Austropuccinia psidii MF-1 TaxID=1389203 RepID=A0A9Q3P731_9BASI|nr:hypothetical protein [Austropuccinia psidii MF-1]